MLNETAMRDCGGSLGTAVAEVFNVWEHRYVHVNNPIWLQRFGEFPLLPEGDGTYACKLQERPDSSDYKSVCPCTFDQQGFPLLFIATFLDHNEAD